MNEKGLTLKFVHIRVNVPDDTTEQTIRRIVDEAFIDALGIDPNSVAESAPPIWWRTRSSDLTSGDPEKRKSYPGTPEHDAWLAETEENAE